MRTDFFEPNGALASRLARLRSLGISGRAFTIGNVILTKEKSAKELGAGDIDHEIRHADQWALSGLATWPNVSYRQALAGPGYLLNVWLDESFAGGRACTVIAGVLTKLFGDGGGHCE